MICPSHMLDRHEGARSLGHFVAIAVPYFPMSGRQNNIKEQRECQIAIRKL